MPPAKIVRDNPLRNRPAIKFPPPRHAAAARPRTQKRGQCNNPACEDPNVVDGTCHGCGRIVDNSNIVSEITFGESGSGAAIVQGSFLGADQGAARSMGPAFARAGGGESREATQREGKGLIHGIASQFKISTATANVGVQTFKMAVTMNFIQGRRMDMVAAACLYLALRLEEKCPIMLIDFADRVSVNVFKLGRVFKALQKAIPGIGRLTEILPEDLIWRFTSRLEFGELNDKVAEDAFRMCRRMTKDWMSDGRKPSGIVGAAIIMAARMNNFRRTVTEVVYVVKVTVQTLQKRLEEFKHTDSSQMTVGDFITSALLIEKAHDPPSFYRNQPEFLAKQKKRKRRDMGNNGYTSEGDEEEEAEAESSKRQKSNSSVPLRKDVDGFAIPHLPTPAATQIPIDPAITEAEITEERIEQETGATFSQLVRDFGDELTTAGDEVEAVSETTPSSPKRGRGRPKGSKAPEVIVSPEWEAAEIEMEDDISELISDPHTQEHAASYAVARKRAAAHVLVEAIENPGRNVSMDTHVGEDEFANDPEVLYCLLSPADVAAKEKVWVNENKIWLRQQQAKQWEARQAENRPPKPKRNRKLKAQMGTGQKGPANSPAEAAISVLKERAFSKKINYSSMNDIFDGLDSLKNKRLGSASTSRASSEYADSPTDSSSRAGSETPSVVNSATGFLIPPKPRKKTVPKSQLTSLTAGTSTPNSQEEDDEEGDDDDYVTEPAEMSVEEKARRMRIEEDEPVENWKEGLGADGDGEEDVIDTGEYFEDPGMGGLSDDEGAFAERDYGEDEGGFGDDGY